MIFYRTLMPFQVMSFDLDDTLYDNTQVIANAEAEFIRFVQTHGGITDFDQESWCVWKQHTAKQDPLLQEDVTLWRTQSLQALLATRQKRYFFAGNAIFFTLASSNNRADTKS